MPSSSSSGSASWSRSGRSSSGVSAVTVDGAIVALGSSCRLISGIECTSSVALLLNVLTKPSSVSSCASLSRLPARLVHGMFLVMRYCLSGGRKSRSLFSSPACHDQVGNWCTR